VKSNIFVTVVFAISLNGLFISVTHKKFHHASKFFERINESELFVSYSIVKVTSSELLFLIIYPSNGLTLVLTLLLFTVTAFRCHFSIDANDILLQPFENKIDFTTAGVEKVFNHGLSITVFVPVISGS
jgi:hypothetical protein